MPPTDTPVSGFKPALCCVVPRVAGWSSLVARRAHNPKVAGSNPAPAMMKAPPDQLVRRRFLVRRRAEVRRKRRVSTALLRRLPQHRHPPAQPVARAVRRWAAAGKGEDEDGALALAA